VIPHHRIDRTLTASAAMHGIALHVRDIRERAWASATFVGARLTIALAITGADPAAWLAALPGQDLPVPGYLVADLVVIDATDVSATLELLLLEA